MKLLLSFLCIATSCFCMAQSSESRERWNELKTSMSDIEVKQLIGDPVKVEPFTTVVNHTFDTSVYWRYSNNYVIVLTNHLYERTETNREALLKSIQQKASKKDSGGLRIVTYGKK